MNEVNDYSLAQNFSKRSFLNSFFRDYQLDSRINLEDDKAVIKLKEDELEIEIAFFSYLGSHQYKKIYFNKMEISFFTLIEILGDKFFESKNILLDDTKKSLNNIHMNLEHNKNKEVFSNYIQSEQSMLLGHPFHPYPKLKKGMSEEEIFKYSPEFKNKIRLKWLLTKVSAYHSNISLKEYKKYCASLAAFDLEDNINLSDEYFLLPMHPWQWEQIKNEENIDNLGIVKITDGKRDWSILSSMRSIYHPNAPFQLKFALNLKLTNSIRHLTSHELVRGQDISNALNGEYCSNFIKEPFFVSIFKSAKICVQFRENPKIDLKCHFLLSSLCETNPRSNNSYLLDKLDPSNKDYSSKAWFQTFLNNCIDPILNLYETKQILLGAHMQNLILKLDKNLNVVNFLFRDFQGTGFTLDAKSKYPHLNIDEKNGNVLNDDELNKVFGYYLMVNSVFGVISALSGKSRWRESMLLADLRSFLSKRPRTSSFTHYLLSSDTLWQKGNFRCSVQGHNENTMNSPWVIYNEIKNPLTQNLRKIQQKDPDYHFEDISFVPFNFEKHLEYFYKWQNQSFVSEFWEMAKPKDELKKYIHELKKSPYQDPYIFEVQGKPVGYFEFYWAHEDRIAPYCQASAYDRGLHLLIGEKNFLKTPYVGKAIIHAGQFLFDQDKRTQRIWAEPRADNIKILKVADKMPGWRFVKTFHFPHKEAALLECTKERFENEK